VSVPRYEHVERTASLTSRLGGASGIGLGITRHFITQPDTHITILDVNATSGAQVFQQLQAEFPSASVSFEQCDVSSWDSQATAFEKIYAEQGRIDVVFANAGISKEGNLLPAKGDAGPVKPNLTTMNVNLVGVIYSKGALYPRFAGTVAKNHQ
jgi:NAD(P)-dependent dehydrogenase (short-subunit alcohol dehydrogenase family)